MNYKQKDKKFTKTKLIYLTIEQFNFSNKLREKKGESFSLIVRELLRKKYKDFPQ